jgi:hypothetical protein
MAWGMLFLFCLSFDLAGSAVGAIVMSLPQALL